MPAESARVVTKKAKKPARPVRPRIPEAQPLMIATKMRLRRATQSTCACEPVPEPVVRASVQMPMRIVYAHAGEGNARRSSQQSTFRKGWLQPQVGGSNHPWRRRSP
eukprot:5758258-Pleurochrysis_carterae.AAC.3